MAEGKKSFVAYADWKGMFDELPDELAGKLIKHIFAYVNDESPETEDFVIKALFSQIKSTLKRDLQKWEDIKENKSLSGRLGNLKRWHLDLYDLYNSEKITIDEAEKIAKDRAVNKLNRKASHSDSPQSQIVANIAVNDSVSVSDNVSVSTKVDVVEETTSSSSSLESKLKSSFSESSEYRKQLESNINLLKSYSNWKTDVAKAHGIARIEDMDVWLDKYHAHVLTISKSDIEVGELKRHFNNWFRKVEKVEVIPKQMTHQEKVEARSKRFMTN